MFAGLDQSVPDDPTLHYSTRTKYKTIYGEGLKILTPKQMIQRLPIALVQVKAGNTSKFTNYIFFLLRKMNC